MDYIELLTHYLTLMANNDDKNLRTEHWKPIFKMNNTNDVTEVLEKFLKDGYVINKESNWYQISVDGRLFVEYGAYRQRKVDDDLDRQKKIQDIQYKKTVDSRISKIYIAQTRQMGKLNYLTKWVMVGTSIAALYYLIQIGKDIVSLFGCHAK